MKSARNLVFAITLFFASGAILHSFIQTSLDRPAIFLNFEIEEKFENSLEEDGFHPADFNDECSHEVAILQAHQNFYKSTYTFSLDIPPEYC